MLHCSHRGSRGHVQNAGTDFQLHTARWRPLVWHFFITVIASYALRTKRSAIPALSRGDRKHEHAQEKKARLRVYQFAQALPTPCNRVLALKTKPST